MVADRQRSSTMVRGVAVLIVALLALSAIGFVPATAGKFLPRKKAFRLFYKKSAANALFAAQGDLLWAQVSSSGVLDSSDGATSATRGAQGDYVVVFNRGIRGCAKLATVNNGGSLNASTDTIPNRNAVAVEVRNDTGGLVDAPFSVALLC